MQKTNINLTTFDINEIVKISDGHKSSNEISITTNIFSPSDVEKIIKLISKDLKLENVNLAWILVTGVLQRGGSNLKAGNAVVFNLGENSLSSQQLNRFIRQIVKNGTNRQLARTISNQIIEIAEIYELPGDLHAQMLIDYPNATMQEKIWCSNFQTQNSNCPDKIRQWLINDYRKRFK